MKRTLGIATLTLAIFLITGTVWALPTAVTIDGIATDWDDATCLVDQGGVDDETSPRRADITAFCAHVDASYMYVAMAWDNTGFGGGNASTAGTRLDVDGDGLFDYIVLGTLNSDPATIAEFSIGACDASGACTNADDVCSSLGSGGGPCTGALAATSGTWDDPFDPAPGHAGSNYCAGTNCGSQDAFIELAIPWTLVGLSGPPSPHVFGDYGSYPSGPAQAPKDVVANGSGIRCLPDGTCFVTTPTAITMASMSAGSLQPVPLVAFAGAFLLALLTVAATRQGPSFVKIQGIRAQVPDRAPRR